VGHFFPLQSSSFSCSISFSYSTIVNKIANFGIINWVIPIILTHLIKQDYLNNTNEFSSLSFDCALCKLGESKFLPFFFASSHASTCFEIIHSDIWGMSHVLSHTQYLYFVTFILIPVFYDIYFLILNTCIL